MNVVDRDEDRALSSQCGQVIMTCVFVGILWLAFVGITFMSVSACIPVVVLFVVFGVFRPPLVVQLNWLLDLFLCPLCDVCDGQQDLFTFPTGIPWASSRLYLSDNFL